MATSELLEYDFPIFMLAGEYYRKGKLPHDPYYYGDIIGVRPFVLYPFNILLSLFMGRRRLDFSFRLLVYYVLLHNLVMSFFAYNFFGGSMFGIFGALAWTYMGYHQQQSITRTAGFMWLTATLCFLNSYHPIFAGISLGMMVLISNPPYTLYFGYCLCAYYLYQFVSPLLF